MKPKYLKILPALFLCLLAFSCNKDDDQQETNNTSTIFNESSFVGISRLNGSSVNIVSYTDGVTSGTTDIDVSSFGGVSLSSFITGISAPIDDTVSLQASLDSVEMVLANGTEVSPFYAGVNVGVVFDAGDGVLRQDFGYNFTYPSEANAIPINTIDNIRLVYIIEYSSSGNLLHTKIFTHFIFFN